MNFHAIGQLRVKTIRPKFSQFMINFVFTGIPGLLVLKFNWLNDGLMKNSQPAYDRENIGLILLNLSMNFILRILIFKLKKN